ncbi:MAG: hypothetical protein GY757_23100 [bacterium]|nr:hypothetical protein [bacterium]
MSKLRRVNQQKKNISSIKSEYERFNFTKNPFPKNPSVTIGADDPRVNGSIYCPELVKTEEEQFEELLIPKPNRPETSRIAFLMDWATRSGRGIGKTAFLNYENTRIMKDFGEELTDGEEVIMSAYISPEISESYNYFWKLSRLIVMKFIKQDVVSAAICRIRAFSGVIPEKVLETVGDDLQSTVGNDEWLQDKKINTMDLNNKVRSQLLKLNINSKLSEVLAFLGCNNSLLEDYFNGLSDTFWRKEGNDFLFNDLVKFFLHAGFGNGILLFDQLEHIFPGLNRRERRMFTEAIRYYFIDGDNENSRKSFFKLLLVIHPYLQELILPHWNATGLERFAALGGEAAYGYTIYFKPIPEEFAVPLALTYMKDSRMNADNSEALTPFNKEALLEALKTTGYVPGKYLLFLNRVVDEAVEQGWDTIDAEKVRMTAKRKNSIEPEEDEVETIPLEKAKVRLK